MRSSLLHRGLAPTVALLLFATACSDDDSTGLVLVNDTTAAALRTPGAERCAPDNGGITLPPDFCAIVVADLVVGGAPARARHMAITPNGDIFVAINTSRTQPTAFGIVGLRDADGDGVAEQQTQFNPNVGGSGIAWGAGSLYFGENGRVLRYRLPAGQLTPTGEPEVVVSG